MAFQNVRSEELKFYTNKKCVMCKLLGFLCAKKTNLCSYCEYVFLCSISYHILDVEEGDVYKSQVSTSSGEKL